MPGNAAVLAAFVSAQTGFTSANANFEASRQAASELMTLRETAEANWMAAINALAVFTESATAGGAAKIQSAGFAVKAPPTPPQPVKQVENVRVGFNGMPGYSGVRWDRDSHAEAYMVQRSVEPITETSWAEVGTVTESKYAGNGTTPGQKYWYRVAGVNRLGQGAWSDPACAR